MIQRISDAVRIATYDPSQIPAVAKLSEAIIDWDNEAVDGLLVALTGSAEELRDVPLDPAGQARHAVGRDPLAPEGSNFLEHALQPIVHHLVVREMKRKLNPHLSRSPAPPSIPGSFSLAVPQSGEAPAGFAGTARGSSSVVPTSALTPPALTPPALTPPALTPPPSTPPPSTPPALAASSWSPGRLEAAETLYRIAKPTSDVRNHLLRWIATAGSEETLDLWLDLICHDPPQSRLGLNLAFAPLMHSSFRPTPELLNRLLTQGTAHSQIAPAVLDLFNFFVRSKKVSVHPGLSRLEQQVELLGKLCGQLGKIEEGNFPPNVLVADINQLVSDSVPLIVALCDTFALTECQPAIPKLYQALQLRHRRVQTEAAAALARLKDDAGKQALIELAEQPIARLRVLAFAEELGFKHEISLELQGEIAVAESQLAIWLSEPEQMGLAPSDLELVHQRLMYWPSYDQPIECYLFRYSYGKGANAHSNIGICGPLTYAFAADLRHLPIDEMYAAFAGWQTVHDEIYQMSPARAKQLHPNEFRRLQRSLKDETFEELTLQTVGSFFGEFVLVATAIHEAEAGTLIIDAHDSTWFERGNSDAPIDWRLAYSIWRGKQLLSRFNSDEGFDL